MVVVSLDTYAELTNNIELLLDEADYAAQADDERLTHTDVFARLRGRL
jgi:hypothetical protein